LTRWLYPKQFHDFSILAGLESALWRGQNCLAEVDSDHFVPHHAHWGFTSAPPRQLAHLFSDLVQDLALKLGITSPFPTVDKLVGLVSFLLEGFKVVLSIFEFRLQLGHSMALLEGCRRSPRR
jgi:hypothetical protein